MRGVVVSLEPPPAIVSAAPLRDRRVAQRVDAERACISESRRVHEEERRRLDDAAVTDDDDVLVRCLLDEVLEPRPHANVERAKALTSRRERTVRRGFRRVAIGVVTPRKTVARPRMELARIAVLDCGTDDVSKCGRGLDRSWKHTGHNKIRIELARRVESSSEGVRLATAELTQPAAPSTASDDTVERRLRFTVANKGETHITHGRRCSKARFVSELTANARSR
jgi:hypothetical protein